MSARRGEKLHWLKVSLRGTAVNRDGLGAMVRIITPSQTLTRYPVAGIPECRRLTQGSTDLAALRLGLLRRCGYPFSRSSVRLSERAAYVAGILRMPLPMRRDEQEDPRPA